MSTEDTWVGCPHCGKGFDANHLGEDVIFELLEDGDSEKTKCPLCEGDIVVSIKLTESYEVKKSE